MKTPSRPARLLSPLHRAHLRCALVDVLEPVLSDLAEDELDALVFAVERWLSGYEAAMGYLG